MKKLIPILSLISAVFALQNCTNEENEYPIQEEVNHKTSDYPPMNDSGRTDSTQSKDNEIDPDPPVKDTHDWRIKP